MSPNLIYISILPLLLAGAPASAAGPGGSAAEFLKIPVGARETSLGGAFTAASTDANSVFYNPAGLAFAEIPEISYAYNNYFSGVSQQWLAAAMPYKGGGLGLGINYLKVAPFNAYDATDNRIGSVSAYDMAAYIGYGRGLETGLGMFPSLRYGAALKYITENLDSSRASGYALDAGLILTPGRKDLRLGLGLENLAASRIEFISKGARPARNFKAGASYYIGSQGDKAAAMISADMNFPEDGPRYMSAGIENTLYGALSLRAGYTAFGDLSNGLSFGLGLGMPGRAGRAIRLDYSYGSSYDLGNVHKFGINCKFGPAGNAPRMVRHEPAAPVPAPRPAIEASVPKEPVVHELPPSEVQEPAAAGPKSEFERQLAPLHNGTPEEAAAAAEYLAGTGDERAVDHFLALTYAEAPEKRMTGIHGLSLCKDQRSLKALERGLGDQSPEVRAAAAAAIGARGDASASPALQEALKKEGSETVKSAVIEALAKMPQEQD